VSAPPGSFEELVAAPSRWLSGEGPHADLVLSTRIRLARNLGQVPFTHRAREEQLQGVLLSVSGAAQHAHSFEHALLLRMNELSAVERQVLVERHLVSHELGDATRPRAVLVAPGERVSLMINEEDHLRLQAITPGFQLAEAWASADTADDELDQSLDFAFSEEIGYLTSCPTNAGTGLRASVLMHLPALMMVGEIQQVLKTIQALNLNVRGAYGENTEPMGSLFQVSNQNTLGKSERELIELLDRVTRKLIEQEERARERMMRDARTQIEDQVWRAYGRLRHGRILTSKDALNLCSALRFGVALGLTGLPPLALINELIIVTYPAHLQYCHGGDLSPAERNVYRAQLVRERLEAAEHENN
jgi:protein arginine kinase